MSIPDAAAEAAAEAIEGYLIGPIEMQREIARAAIEAALPAIREAIAQEIVSDGPKHPYKADQTARINAWCAGLHAAARIARGGTP